MLDMATTTVAMNKIIQSVADQKTVIPDGWAMDAEGYPTNDGLTGLKGLLMPLGGYKGSGLAMMVEILCAVLSGGAMSNQVGGVYIMDRPMGTSQMFLAVDIQRFLPLSEFQSRMEHLVTSAKSARPGPGYEEVLVAGDPEWRVEARRIPEGVPLAKKVEDQLNELAVELGLRPLRM